MLAICATAPCAAPVHAQSACAGTDDACHQREFDLACSHRPFDRDACEAWAQSLQAAPDAGQPIPRLWTALAYRRLAEGRDDGEALAQRELAHRIYVDLAAADPSNVDARLGLVSLSDDPAERERLLREIVEIAPERAFELELLARQLSANGRALEAAEVYERAYTVAEEMHKWHVAIETLRAYERAAVPNRAVAFRARARSDSRLDALTAEVAGPAADEPERAAAVLKVVCYHAFVDVLGGAGCLAGLRAVAASARTLRSVPLAETFAGALRTASLAGWRLHMEDAAWPEEFRAALGEIIDAETTSPLLRSVHREMTLHAPVDIIVVD